jgi:DNA primase
VNRQVLDELKQQISLLDYLQAQDWRPARRLSRGRWMGLCPLHADHQPSFLVHPSKSLFYCYGCGRGGDVIRFAELYHQVKFPQAVALLQQWRGLPPILRKAADFYRMQLHRHSEAVAYLYQRGVRLKELVEHMRIGYAPGGCLRGWLMQLGFPVEILRQAGLVTGAGYDAYIHRIVFPLEACSACAGQPGLNGLQMSPGRRRDPSRMRRFGDSQVVANQVSAYGRFNTTGTRLLDERAGPNSDQEEHCNRLFP